MAVNVTYREANPVVPTVTTIKNSPLSNQEIDGNFKSIKDAIDPLGTSAGAGLIGVAPVGGVVATTVQGAIAELDSEKVNTANLTASSGSSLVGYDGGTVQDVLDALTGPNGAGSVGYMPAGTGASLRTVEGKQRESVSVLDFIPVTEHASIKAKTSTLDLSPYFALAFAAAKSVKAPAGQYCVTNLVIPDGCSIEGELSGNDNASASYTTIIKHIATSLSDVIIADSSSQSVYRSGGVINNIAVLAGDFSRYGINFVNPLGARAGNIYGTGYFSEAFLGISGTLFFELDTLNYLYTGPLRTPAAVHFRSFNGGIVGTSAVFRRVYAHGNLSDPTKGIYNVFKFDPAACINAHIELCATESISGPVFEIGKGNIVYVDRHYIENVPNSNTSSAPIFRVGVTGAAAPNNAYDTTTALHLSRLWGLGYTGGAATDIVLVEVDQAEKIILDDLSITRVNTLVKGTSATQRVVFQKIYSQQITVPVTGVTSSKIINLGGNSFEGSANITDSANTGLMGDRVNLLSSTLLNGSQYYARDKGARGCLEIYNKTTGVWGQTMPAWAAAPTTGTWNRGDVVFNMFALQGSRIGWICTGAGSPGSWEPFGQAGMLTSISGTPSFVGQMAVVGSVGYMAVGTASSADWKQIT